MLPNGIVQISANSNSIISVHPLNCEYIINKSCLMNSGMGSPFPSLLKSTRLCLASREFYINFKTHRNCSYVCKTEVPHAFDAIYKKVSITKDVFLKTNIQNIIMEQKSN